LKVHYYQDAAAFYALFSWQSSTSKPCVALGCKNAMRLLSAPSLGLW
jgi:hypothetical protein